MHVVVPGQTSMILIRCIKPDTGEEFVPTTATWEILAGSGVIAFGIPIIGGTRAGVQNDWSALQAGEHYTLKLTLDSYVLRYPLYAARRWFPQPIGPTDFEAKFPHLATLLPTGVTTGHFLNDAWADLVDQLTARLGQYPDNLWDSQRFVRALELETAARIYERSALSSTSADFTLAKQYRKQAIEAFDRAVAGLWLDANKDAQYTAADRQISLRGIRLTR